MYNTKIKMSLIPSIIGQEIVAQSRGVVKTVPIIAGKPGIGKSEMMKNIGNQLNMNVFIRSLGALPYEWFSGLPEFQDYKVNEDWHEYGVQSSKATSWTISDLIKSINEYTEISLSQGKKGLLVLLDDFHLVDGITQKYLFELLQNKTLQNFKLHKKAYLVGAMNDSELDGMQDLYRAVLDRIAVYSMDFELDYWYSKVGYMLHPIVASFVKNEANIKYLTGEDVMNKVTPSPRSWTEFSQILTSSEQFMKSSDYESYLKAFAISRLGEDATLALLDHFKIFMKYDFESIASGKISVDISNDVIDQIIYSMVVRAIIDEKTARVVVDIINKNKEKKIFYNNAINELIELNKQKSNFQEAKMNGISYAYNQLLFDEENLDDVLESLLDELM